MEIPFGFIENIFFDFFFFPVFDMAENSTNYKVSNEKLFLPLSKLSKFFFFLNKNIFGMLNYFVGYVNKLIWLTILESWFYDFF